MSERDELRGTLSNTICNASNYTKRAQPHLMGSDMSTVLDKTADAILAAGYSKPRTITSAEELDALKLPAIIDCKNGGVAKVEYMHGPGRQKYAEFLFGEADESHTLAALAEWALPATVLYEPTP